MKSALASLFAPPLDLLAPDCCAVCAGPVAPSTPGWCVDCWAALPWLPPLTCAGCGQPTVDEVCGLCAGRGQPWQRIAAAVHYRDQAADLLTRWKYGPEPWLSRPLGHLLVHALRYELPEHPDLVVPIPQSPVAWRERGFSPAQDLARALARAHRLPVQHPLSRGRTASAQVGLTAAERRRNVDRLFRVPARQARALRGRHVLLVDDVVTTTATVGAAARQLRRAGCDRVTVVALGRSPADSAG